MKQNFFLMLLAAFMLFGATFVASASDTPVVNDGKWYFVKSQRTNSGGHYWTFDGKDVHPQALTKADNQMFTLVSSPDSKVNIKTFSGFLMNDRFRNNGDDNDSPSFDEIGVTVGFDLVSNVVDGAQGWAFKGGLNGGLHQGAGSWNWRVGSSNWYNLDDYCTFFFYEVSLDAELKFLINDAQAIFNAATVGVVPGTYPSDAKTAFGNAIVAAQSTIGSTSQDDVEAAMAALNAAIITFNASKSTLAGATPVADDGKWYFVKSNRSATAGRFWTLQNSITGAPNTGYWVTPSELTQADAQKFTLVTSSTGKVRFKSFDGKEMAASGEFVTSGFTTNGFTMTSALTSTYLNVAKGVQAWAFPGEGQALHQNNGGGWTVQSNWGDINDNGFFVFYDATVDVDLQIMITEASTVVASSVAGTAPGATPQAAIDALGAAIAAAREVLGSTNTTDIDRAVVALSAAIATFNTEKIGFVDSSTADAPKWYVIKNYTRGGIGSTIYAPGFDLQIVGGSVVNSIPSDGSGVGVQAAGLQHLFRFEKDLATGKYRIVNALYADGEVLQASGNSAPINYGTATIPSTMWDIISLGMGTNGKNILKFKSTNGSIWHLDGSFKLVSYDGALNSASAWYVEEYTGDVSALSTPSFNAGISKIESAFTSLPVGTDPFTGTAAAQEVLLLAKSRLVEAYNDGAVTSDFGAAVAAVDAAIAVYWESLQFPFSTEAEPFWCVIQSVGNNANVFDALMSKEETTDILRGILPVDVPNTIVDYKTIFRFEKNEAGKVAIINYDGTSVTPTIATSFTFSSTPTFVWDLLKVKTNGNTFVFQSGPGASINISNAADAKVRYYTSYFAGGISDFGNQFKIYPNDFYYAGTAVGSIDNKQAIRVLVVNRTITVADYSVEVYTTTGVKVHNKNLSNGVYVVKANDETYKVIVK